MCIMPPMPPKQRFQLFLEADQLAALRRVEARTGAPLAAQIRRAVDAYLQKQGERGERTRKHAST